MGQEKGEKFMSYLNSVTIIGFVGADPEQRQARNNNGSKFTVLSVATQRSWKNTDERSRPIPLIPWALSCNSNGDQAGALFLR
jgi:Single-strand binding protein family